MSELREVAQQMYNEVIKAQNKLLQIGRANPGAYYTGNQEIDSLLLILYTMQSRLESFLASLPQEVGQEC